MSEEQHFIRNLTNVKDWRIGIGSIGHGANQGIIEDKVIVNLTSTSFDLLSSKHNVMHYLPSEGF